MRKFIALALLALSVTAAADEVGDTTIVYNNRQYVIADDSTAVRVSVYTPDGSELRKTQETAFTDEQEVERFYITSPLLGWGHRYERTTPQFYVGFTGLSGSALGLGSTDRLPAKTFRSYEVGANFMEASEWLNKRHTWSFSLLYDLTFSRFLLDNHSILYKGADGNATVQSAPEEGVRNSSFFRMGFRIKAMFKWYKYFRNPDDDRLCIGAGLSADAYSKAFTFSSYQQDGNIFASGAGYKSTGLSFAVQVSYAGIILYGQKALTPMFRSSEGPKCYPFSFGIGFTL